MASSTGAAEPLTKAYVGLRIDALDPLQFDVWGITCNFSQHREVACMAIRHLTSKGRPVIVGGSDAIAEPGDYLRAGAALIVTDKSGGANRSAIEYVLGRCPRSELAGVLLPDGTVGAKWMKPMDPQDWPLPSLEVARACIGTDYWSAEFPQHLLGIGSVFSDIGCDRKCDFCQTPNYGVGYKRMSPKRVIEWLARQKEAGAGSVIGSSDQFLGRVLWDGGREEVLEIMQGVRDLDLAMLWPNGLELRKATRGRGFNRAGTDLTPDEELINAVWGWDGRRGTFHAYMPAECPLTGRENYAKLLPWQEHCELMRAVVRSGLPALSYGIIIGFEDETEDSLLRLEEAIHYLHDDLTRINPELIFQVSSFAISPIPGRCRASNCAPPACCASTTRSSMAVCGRPAWTRTRSATSASPSGRSACWASAPSRAARPSSTPTSRLHQTRCARHSAYGDLLLLVILLLAEPA